MMGSSRTNLMKCSSPDFRYFFRFSIERYPSPLYPSPDGIPDQVEKLKKDQAVTFGGLVRRRQQRKAAHGFLERASARRVAFDLGAELARDARRPRRPVAAAGERFGE